MATPKRPSVGAAAAASFPQRASFLSEIGGKGAQEPSSEGKKESPKEPKKKAAPPAPALIPVEPPQPDLFPQRSLTFDMPEPLLLDLDSLVLALKKASRGRGRVTKRAVVEAIVTRALNDYKAKGEQADLFKRLLTEGVSDR